MLREHEETVVRFALNWFAFGCTNSSLRTPLLSEITNSACSLRSCRKLMDNQVAMSEDERERIMAEHEKQMVKLENR